MDGPRQTGRMLMKQSSRSLSSTLDWGHEGHICKVLQEDGRSTKYRAMITYLCCRKKLSWVTCSILSMINYDCSMSRKPDLHYWPIFRRLKINHDSHEFILEFGTVTNSKAFCTYENFEIFYTTNRDTLSKLQTKSWYYPSENRSKLGQKDLILTYSTF